MHARHATGWLRLAADAGLPEAQYALAVGIRERRFEDDTGDAERLLQAAAQHVNSAHLELAALYMSGTDHRNWLEAAGRVQACYERALNEQDTELA